MEMESRLKQTVPIYAETEAAHQNLAKDGFISRLALLDKTRERIEKEQELKAQTHQVASLRANHRTVAQAARHKLPRAIDNNFRTNAAMRTGNACGWSRKPARQAYRRDLLELKAPQDGIVKDLATHTPGTVVSPGTILLDLVPRHDPVKAESVGHEAKMPDGWKSIRRSRSNWPRFPSPSTA